ncbi:MAG TPA: glycosyltransferase family 2 protein [Patescibacteria group bacterium]|nr:glycosyltransferase family 2 protein [Patescibacteria group bacterium]
MMKHIAIVIVTHNGWEDTLDCLRSIAHLEKDGVSLSVVHVDNHSEKFEIRNSKFETIITSLKSKQICFENIRLNSNRGFSGGNNEGIKKALENGADYVMLLNNDTVVHKDLVMNLTRAAEEKSDAGITGPKIYFAEGYEYHHSRYGLKERGKVIWYAGGMIDWDNVYLSHRGVDEVDRGQYDREEETGFITGCCMFVKREVFEKVGFLDERYFLYLEDADFCIRAKKKGFLTWYIPHAVLWHRNAQSTGKPGSPLHVYYQTRNRLLFGMNYAPLRTKFALIRESMKLLREGGVRRKAVTDYFTGRMGKGSIHQINK